MTASCYSWLIHIVRV